MRYACAHAHQQVVVLGLVLLDRLVVVPKAGEADHVQCHAQRGLVDVEKVPSEKGPPRKVYSLNSQGQDYLHEFWRTWSFLTERLERLHEGGR